MLELFNFKRLEFLLRMVRLLRLVWFVRLLTFVEWWVSCGC